MWSGSGSGIAKWLQCPRETYWVALFQCFYGGAASVSSR